MAFSSIAGRFGNAGQTDYSTADFVAATLNMDRPKLPAPHQIVTELWRSVALTDPSSKRSLTFHAGITLRETLLGFARQEKWPGPRDNTRQSQ